MKLFRNIETGLLGTLVLVLLIGIITMPAQECPGDAFSVRIETASLLKSGHFGVPAEIATHIGDRGQFYFNNEKTGDWYSKYGILNTLIYIPIMALERIVTVTSDYSSPYRVLFLNIHNIVISLGCAALFYLTARLFCESQKASSLFALSVIYTTFCWNHFRAQNFEIHQTLFMSGALYFAFRVIRAKGFSDEIQSRRINEKALLYCALFLIALILSKSVYVLILPVFTLALAWPLAWESKKGPNAKHSQVKSFLMWFFIPVVLGFCLLLLVNDLRFGSPLNCGYNQWVREKDPFSGNLLHGILGFLFSAQFGIFACFPILLLALFYWRVFYERFSRESWLIIFTGLVVLIAYSSYVRWNGAWSYGPRYMLPILPFLSLPFVFLIDALISAPLSLRKSFSAGLVIGLLSISLYMQIMVNSLLFFTWWDLREGFFAKVNQLEINCYLDGLPFGIINADLIAFRNGKPFPPFEAIKSQMSESQYDENETNLRKKIIYNYYFFK